jgi:hypothetical protein
MRSVMAAINMVALTYSSNFTLKWVVRARRMTMRLGKRIRFSLCRAQRELQSNPWRYDWRMTVTSSNWSPTTVLIP